MAPLRMSLQDLPTEILLDVAELIQCPPYPPSSPSSSKPPSGCFPLDTPASQANLRQLQRCAAVCRGLRNVFRPLVWSRVVIMCGEDDERVEPGVEGGLEQRPRTSSDKLTRTLSVLHALLTSHPELGSFIRELGMYIPGDSEGYQSRAGSSTSRGTCSDVGADTSPSIQLGATTSADALSASPSAPASGLALFPRIASKLTQLRSLTLVSHQLHTGKPARPADGQHTPNAAATPGASTGLRVDWDALHPAIRHGLERLFDNPSLNAVQMIGIVAPPRLLFGRGFAPFEHPQPASAYPSGRPRAQAFGKRSSNRGTLKGLKSVTLMAHCPMSTSRLEHIDSVTDMLHSRSSKDHWASREFSLGPTVQIGAGTHGGGVATGLSAGEGSGRLSHHQHNHGSLNGHGAVNGHVGQQQNGNGLGNGSGEPGRRRLISDPAPLHTPSSDNLRASFASSASTSSSGNCTDEDGNGGATRPANGVYDNDLEERTAPLQSLRLAYCDTSYLRYISLLYPASFLNLTNLSLNVIERDLPFCQWFLDQAITPSTSHDGPGPVSDGNLTAFDLTIRCNTAPSSYGLFELHALDFGLGRRGTNLKKLSLRYLLLSQVTESVRNAIEVNVRSALECRGIEFVAAQQIGVGSEWDRGRIGRNGREDIMGGGLEEIHLVVDWTHDGDEILLDAFRSVDRIVEERYSSCDPNHRLHTSGRPRESRPALKSFTVDATHWPCMSHCNFRRSVARSPNVADPGAANDEGTLDAFLPFLSTHARGLGVDVKSRYVLENRREGWVL